MGSSRPTRLEPPCSCFATSAFMGYRWPALAVVGFCGPALAFVGLDWLSWAFDGTPVGSVNRIISKTRKKNIPGARDVTRLEPPLLLSAFVGYRGPALAVAFVGLRWHTCR